MLALAYPENIGSNFFAVLGFPSEFWKASHTLYSIGGFSDSSGNLARILLSSLDIFISLWLVCTSRSAFSGQVLDQLHVASQNIGNDDVESLESIALRVYYSLSRQKYVKGLRSTNIISCNADVKTPCPGLWLASLDAADTESGVRFQSPRHNSQCRTMVPYPAPNDPGSSSNRISLVQKLNLKIATTLDPAMCPTNWCRSYPYLNSSPVAPKPKLIASQMNLIMLSSFMSLEFQTHHSGV
ncbi:hypothetical protein VNO77_31277 [Canavalia gladiata]|uniref:Uncharacterized protein n=1 Tax=Canavalia gladiata TaxID=3824 RepID=A0AAN9KRT3_CANGL